MWHCVLHQACSTAAAHIDLEKNHTSIRFSRYLPHFFPFLVPSSLTIAPHLLLYNMPPLTMTPITLSSDWKFVQCVLVPSCTGKSAKGVGGHIQAHTPHWVTKQQQQQQQWRLGGVGIVSSEASVNRSTGPLYCSCSCWLTLYITSEGETQDEAERLLIKWSHLSVSASHLLPLLHPFQGYPAGGGGREGQRRWQPTWSSFTKQPWTNEGPSIERWLWLAICPCGYGV